METRFKNYSTPNFQARLIAKARIKSNNQQINLYALNSSDTDFAKDLYKKLDLKALYPNLESYEDFDAWKTIIRNGISKVGFQDVVLAVHDKKPCGIMAFLKKENQVNLSDLATWRVRPDENVFYAGKVLMHHLFDFAHKNEAWNISLYTASATPRGKSCKDFYSKLGFRRSMNNSMNLFGADYSKKAKELEDYFVYKQVKNALEINPYQNFSLDFEGTLFDKIKKFFD